MRTGVAWFGGADQRAPSWPARDQPRADGLTRRTAMPTNKKPHFKKKKKAVEDNDDAEIIDEGEYEGEGVLGFAGDVESGGGGGRGGWRSQEGAQTNFFAAHRAPLGASRISQNFARAHSPNQRANPAASNRWASLPACAAR